MARLTLALGRLPYYGLHHWLFVGQLVSAGAAVYAQAGPLVWLATLALALFAVLGWLRALGTLRHISDTPRSRIASAAQGYVALQGRARPLEGLPLLSPLNGLPVLWYRLRIERNDGNNRWEDVETQESDACLLLDDGSATCAIDPAGADIHARHRECVTRGDLRYTQWCLLKDEDLYVLGDFRTLHGDHLTLSEREAVREILADWKRDRAGLLARFDRDGSGDIDEAEWEHARSAAQEAARAARAQAAQAAAVHIVRKPQDRRPYIVSAVSRGRLRLPHYLWGGLSMLLFLAACAAFALLAQHGRLELPL